MTAIVQERPGATEARPVLTPTLVAERLAWRARREQDACRLLIEALGGDDEAEHDAPATEARQRHGLP